MAAKVKQPPPPPEEHVWETALRITPELTPADPALISDGGGLPFTIAAAFGAPDPLQPAERLDPEDPRIQALLKQIDLGRQVAMPRRTLRPKAKPAPISAEEKLSGWRVLASTEDEMLYGRGRPPRLLTAPVRRWRGEKWEPLGASNSRPLRAYREGARASLWRFPPEFKPTPEATELRILLTEISKATGNAAVDRLLPTELFVGDELLLLRFFVSPIEGYVAGTRQYETPIILELPEPLGERQVSDGGAYNVQL